MVAGARLRNLIQSRSKDEILVDAIKQNAPDVLVVRGTKWTEPMLAAGPVSWSFAPARATNTIDVAVLPSAAFTFRLSGKNSIAVAELLSLDTRARTVA